MGADALLRFKSQGLWRMESCVRAAIQAAVPALDDDVAEYIAGSVVVASEDMDEPQPISAERVEDLIA
eukprot:COSAG06_NODE_14718_length_1131_cov_15.507752_2_plen_67_part_01